MIASNKLLRVLLAGALILTSCITHAPLKFHVVPAPTTYFLRAPDSHQTPFTDLLRAYNGYQRGNPSIDLRPGMELHVENAYYQPGKSRRGLDGFLGTEVARYKVQSHRGLHLVSFQSMSGRPSEQLPVQQLIRASQQRNRYYSLYFEILFRKSNNPRGSVLLGADSEEEMSRLAKVLLSDPDSVCGEASRNCTVFPEACSVAVEMEIIVNGAPRSVIWGSLLSSVVDHPRNLKLLRIYNRRPTPVELDARDANALRLPLLPYDNVKWN